MKRFGILTVHRDKKRWWKKFFCCVEIVDRFQTQAEVLVGQLAWSEEELRRIPSFIKRRIYYKSCRFMKKLGCEKVDADSLCQGILWGTASLEGYITPIPAEQMQAGISYLFQKEKEFPFEVLIKTRVLSRIPDKLLGFLCPRITKLWLWCPDMKQGERFGEKICDAFGFYPEIIMSPPTRMKKCLVLDFNLGSISFENRVLDGIEYAMNFHHYQVDQRYFLMDARIPFHSLNFVSWHHKNG